MDQDIFDQFIEQLERYVRERLIPAEKDVIEQDRIPDDILNEMREMGLFGLTIPEAYGGAGMNIAEYARTINVLSYAMSTIFHLGEPPVLGWCGHVRDVVAKEDGVWKIARKEIMPWAGKVLERFARRG